MTDSTTATIEAPIDYGDSPLRTIISWLAYPLGVLLPMGILISIIDLDNPKTVLPYVFVGAATAALFELLQPHTRKWRRSHGDVITDLLHFTLTTFLTIQIRTAIVVGLFLLINKTSGDFALIDWPQSLPLAFQFFIGLAVAEFGSYWRHRLFHEWSLAWRCHSIHHSPARLYFLNATRFHVIDLMVGGMSSSIMLALFGAPLEVVVLVGLFTGIHGNWQHANIRYKLGPLNWLISGAELHRWHHSSIIEHSNSNYGNNLIIWDTLFGTRCLPDKEQDITELGLHNNAHRFPKTWWGQQALPFFWKRMLKPRCAKPSAQEQ